MACRDNFKTDVEERLVKNMARFPYASGEVARAQPFVGFTHKRTIALYLYTTSFLGPPGHYSRKSYRLQQIDRDQMADVRLEN